MPKKPISKDAISAPKLTYRDADGHPHFVEKQEEAARGSEQHDDEQKPQTAVPNITPPD